MAVLAVVFMLPLCGHDQPYAAGRIVPQRGENLVHVALAGEAACMRRAGQAVPTRDHALRLFRPIAINVPHRRLAKGVLKQPAEVELRERSRRREIAKHDLFPKVVIDVIHDPSATFKLQPEWNFSTLLRPMRAHIPQRFRNCLIRTLFSRLRD